MADEPLKSFDRRMEELAGRFESDRFDHIDYRTLLARVLEAVHDNQDLFCCDAAQCAGTPAYDLLLEMLDFCILDRIAERDNTEEVTEYFWRMSRYNAAGTVELIGEWVAEGFKDSTAEIVDLAIGYLSPELKAYLVD